MTANNFPAWYQNFAKIYCEIDINNYQRIKDIYSDDVLFVDPAHKLQGITSLLSYFEHLYTNLQYCSFQIDDQIVDELEAAIYWTMEFQHPKLNSGQTIVVEGHSHLISDGKAVTHHRDYIDLGAMLYEHVPLLGRAIKIIKQRLS